MTTISEKAKKEILKLSKSKVFRKDMKAVASKCHNPFFKNRKANIKNYVEFVTQFNEFINHEPKPFRKIIDRDMRL